MGDWITINEKDGYPIKSFVTPSHYKDDIERVLIPYGLIQDRVEKLAHDISKEITKPLHVICVLKGAFEFFSDLTRHLKKLPNKNGEQIPMSLEFAKVKSYENTESTGNVEISLTEQDLKGFKGKDLLIVEDIVDTGKTMVALTELLKKYEPASIKVCALLLKRTTRSNSFTPNYTAFSIPDLFVIGYGLDYNQYYRDLSYIGVINKNGIDKYSV